MDAGHAFLLVETAATIFMSGVLWTMQLLNYPLLALVGRAAFTSYETAHNRRFGLVVFPGVLAALAGTIGLLASPPRQIPWWAPGCELALVVVIIVSTVMLQGRQHAALARGFDAVTLRGLVRSGSGLPHRQAATCPELPQPWTRTARRASPFLKLLLAEPGYLARRAMQLAAKRTSLEPLPRRGKQRAGRRPFVSQTTPAKG
jgi:hypothetical protein